MRRERVPAAQCAWVCLSLSGLNFGREDQCSWSPASSLFEFYNRHRGALWISLNKAPEKDNKLWWEWDHNPPNGCFVLSVGWLFLSFSVCLSGTFTQNEPESHSSLCITSDVKQYLVDRHFSGSWARSVGYDFIFHLPLQMMHFKRSENMLGLWLIFSTFLFMSAKVLLQIHKQLLCQSLLTAFLPPPQADMPEFRLQFD